MRFSIERLEAYGTLWSKVCIISDALSVEHPVASLVMLRTDMSGPDVYQRKKFAEISREQPAEGYALKALHLLHIWTIIRPHLVAKATS